MKSKITIFILVTSALIMLLAFMGIGQKRYSQPNVSLPNVPKPVITPKSTWDSSDGKATLIMEKKTEPNSSVYSFSTTDNLIYSTTVPVSNIFSIPYNSWSPDNKYFFLKETADGNNNYYVFSSQNKMFAGNSKFLKVNEEFAKKLINYQLADVTGWAAPNLLLVNTNELNGKQGPSFWFEISSQNFIKLSTRFN